MDQTVKKSWIEALRSGEYGKCKGELRNGTYFCVLGVLCDLHSKATGTSWTYTHQDSRYTYLGIYEYLPDDVIEWAGLDDQPFIIDDEGKYRPIEDLNDGPNKPLEKDIGLSFEQLAKLIEEQL